MSVYFHSFPQVIICISAIDIAIKTIIEEKIKILYSVLLLNVKNFSCNSAAIDIKHAKINNTQRMVIKPPMLN